MIAWARSSTFGDGSRRSGSGPGRIFNGFSPVLTVVAQAAFNVAVTPLAIPALTGPFVLETWIFLLPRPFR
jgi:urea transporter